MTLSNFSFDFSTAMISKRFFFGLGLGLALLSPTSGRAQMGNDNPTGVSGFYNGNVQTGGSYDPYTGNATRSVTDLVVAGGVGKYPLAFTRTMNTRYTPGAGTLEFGQSGTWRHNYQWSIDSFSFQSNAPDKWYAMPLVYTVNYPDGRRLSFFNSATDTMMRAGSGVSDRFQKPAGTEGGDCYLLLPDGGKAWFTMSVQRWGDDFGPVTSTFDFEFNGIVDPHGQATTISYPGNGSMQITEPAGRYLQVFYVTAPWNGDTLIDRVVASDGRSVKYNYGPYQPAGATTYSYLGNVQYLDRNGASYTQAIYWYQPGNTDPNGRPLISACIDPMYGGPMWAIGYTFLPGSSGGVYGQLAHEHYFNPANGQTGAPVSSLTASGTSRTETRGDGHARSFNYSGGKLVNYTDFKGQTSDISYDGNGFVGSVTDARGHTTTMIREGIIGAISQYKHHDQSYVGYAYWNTNGAPYHLQIRGDERGKNTYFTRDGNFRLTRIDYPDYPNGAYETFAYNARDQVTSHRMTSGGMEYFYYDARGLMYASSNPAGTTYFYYDVHDRLAQVKNPRGHSTFYQYNARGQVTRVTHPDGTSVQIEYDNHGNKISVTDELNHTTTYAYDDYNRVVSVTQPGLPAATFNYAQDWANPYLHTTSSVKGFLSPTQTPIHYAYDENWQRTITREAAGTPDDAWTFFGYDPAGNLTWAQDPRGHATHFGYDSRNRRTSATNALSETTSWQYDATSNLTRETRPDQSYRRLEYDSMNRVIDSYGFANERTQYIRNLAGNVTQMIDAKNASYGFGYDTLGRKTSATYPADATGVSRNENFWYDGASNLIQYKNPNNQYPFPGVRQP